MFNPMRDTVYLPSVYIKSQALCQTGAIAQFLTQAGNYMADLRFVIYKWRADVKIQESLYKPWSESDIL